MNNKYLRFLSLYLSILLLFPFLLYAQTGELHVESFYLENGMKVLICEDHAAPEIYGGVVVHVGSKNDPADATGMAHYFEHIMFKGTDRIGTIDWTAERPYLDSISALYDTLHTTSNAEDRKAIQREINRLSIASAQYAIPNEMDQILGKMGGKGINAYTNHDVTVYYNRFPSNQLESWMDIYYERFRYPVFRLFQSELETVYEEKNMYADNPFERAFENLMEEIFGEHPYSHPILGYSDHLKNPQISKMKQFFDTYYVPNNMTLILTGDLTLNEAKILAERSFGLLQSKELPKENFPEIPAISGRKEISKRLTPVKAGALGYFTCTADHEDLYKVKLLSALFSNDAESGLIDQLNNESRLYTAFVLDYILKEVGVMGFVFVPKIVGQSLNSAEKLIMACIDSVKKGNFSDQLFEAVKMEFLVNMKKDLESQSKKFNLLLSFENEGGDWHAYNKAVKELREITKQEIITIANKYLGDNYLAYNTKMGFPKKDKISKPDWQPVIPENSDRKSEFAMEVEERKVEPIKSQYIDFKKDIEIIDCDEHYQLYASKNPVNDIFTLELNFYCGTNHIPEIRSAVDYFNRTGTKTKSQNQFQMELQQLGGSMRVQSGANFFVITIEGVEENFLPILTLCAEKFKTPQEDQKVIENMFSDEKTNYRMYRYSPSNWAYPLFQYMLYGEHSPYIDRPGIREMKQFTPQELIQYIKAAISVNGYITYVGNSEPGEIAQIIRSHFPLSEKPKQNEIIGKARQVFAEDQLYYIHSGRTRQSNIYFYRDGIKYENDKDRLTASCFNTYFGQGMFSIVFQEIREFRSLGYSASASYLFYYLNSAPGFLYGSLGTQADKTVEAITAMRDLMLQLPQKPEKFETAKEAAINSQRSSYISFRNIPEQVHNWMKEGKTTDPRPDFLDFLQTLTLDDINIFYNKSVNNNPLSIAFVGDIRKVNKKELSPFGKIRKVKFSQVYKK